jgi:hypothetical protein
MENILTLNTSAEIGPVKIFLRRLGHLFLDPVRFFHEDFPRLEGNSAWAFGITNAWLASICAFIVSTFNSFFLARLFESWVQRLLVSEEGFSFLALNEKTFLWTAGALLAAPFFLLLRIFLGGLVVYVFTRLLVEEQNGGPDRVSLSAVMRLQAVALSGRWFSVVPVFGGVLGFLVSLILLVTGIRERFAVSNRRAAAIVLAPYALLLLIAVMVGIVFLVALAQLPATELFDMDTNGFGF